MINKNHKRLILVGKGASGKDFTRKKLQSRGYKYGISYTSRPPRENETDGIDYHFLSEERFNELIEQGFFYEHVSFNSWHYGTSMEQFHSDDLFIMTPHGISLLNEEDRKRSFIIYFEIPEEIRKQRLMERGDVDKVDRRLAADNADFKDFTDYDLKITNPDF